MQSVGSHHFAVVGLTLPLVPVELHPKILLWQHCDYRMRELEHWYVVVLAGQGQVVVVVPSGMVHLFC